MFGHVQWEIVTTGYLNSAVLFVQQVYRFFLIAGDSDCLQESMCKYKTCEKVINNTAWL